MIGLEYACQVTGIGYTELGKRLKLKPQTVKTWIYENRKIAQKHHERLTEIFGVSEVFLQKQITEEDKIWYLSREAERLKTAN